MPQNKESNKEAARLRKQNQRKRDKEEVTTDVTNLEMSHNSPNMSQPIVTQLFRYIDGKKVLLDKVPPGFKVLSDGQVWQPTLVIKPVVIDDPIRKERAERYWNWYGCNIKDGRMLGAS